MKKTIFFDFNGTIIDDLRLSLDILNKMLVENGHEGNITQERYKEIFRFPIIEYYKLAGFDFKNKSFEELSVDFINYYQHASFNCMLHEGVVDLFKDLIEDGYKLVVLSASERNNLLEQTNYFDITKYFDDILGIENIYAKSKVKIGKDYIESRGLNKEECIMIGDTLHDKEVADEMGIDCILFDGGHQSRNILKAANATIVSSYKEFEEIVRKL